MKVTREPVFNPLRAMKWLSILEYFRARYLTLLFMPVFKHSSSFTQCVVSVRCYTIFFFCVIYYIMF